MHLSKLPSGKWKVDVCVNRRRASATARTKAEAAVIGAELLLELGGSTQRRNVTVAELVGAWFAESTLSATFRCDARRVIDRTPETFTDRLIADVTPSVISGLYRQLQRDGWSVHRVRRLHTVLSSAWSLARRWEWTTHNPFAAVTKPTKPKVPITPPTPAEVASILDAADERLRLYLYVASAIGARRGEVCGLQWADIADGAVIVRRALSYAPESAVTVTEGKTGKAGHRVVAIDADLAAMLRHHRVAQIEMAIKAGLPSPVWVFSHDAGLNPWRPDFVTREFARTRAAAGVRSSIRLHDLRHFVATQLLAAGVPMKVVSERLGHRQISTTADVYGHYVQAADQTAAAVMASLRPAR